ncbi:MAG: 5-oxoprolinase subunit PxpB [Bacteroidota bacterium]|nr:5-oxoprolinase subunit PxpB [Bacteroidota bacterium]
MSAMINRYQPAVSIFPLGDSAITAELGGDADEELNSKALAMQDWLIARRFPGILDIIVAYHSVSVFYDPVRVRQERPDCRQGAFACVRDCLEEAWREARPAFVPERGTIRVPVCYGGEFGPDLEAVAEDKGASAEDCVGWHVGRTYRVFMVGFLPGFPYLGVVDERLRVPRREKPSPVKAGSVGLAGKQTGIYPVDSPGGWRIIGRTPWKLFDRDADMPIRLKTGDRVEFFPISPEEFAAEVARLAGLPRVAGQSPP